MVARRIRPTRPLAPHGLPGHLVGFVEALRGSGISVGPSETVDAGRVMATLGLGDREVLREGLACAVLRQPDHRHGLRVRGSTSLDEGTGVSITNGDNPREWSGDAGVRFHGFELLALGLSDVQLAFSFGESGLGNADLGFVVLVSGKGIVELLLRDQSGTRIRCLFQSSVSSVCGRIRCLSFFHFIVGASDGLLAALHHSFRSKDLRSQLGHFEHGERLAFFHVVAHVHEDGLNVTGDLGVDIDFLEWFEFGGECE